MSNRTKRPYKCESPDCGLQFEISVFTNHPSPRTTPCPKCKSDAGRVWDPNGTHVMTKGPGFSGRTSRMKRDLKRRNEKLSKTQWENHKPLDLVGKARNPTEGGPFAKKKP